MNPGVIGEWILPCLLCLAALGALGTGKEVYEPLRRGAGEGLETLLRVLPTLIVILPAIGMFRASGALEWLTALTAPLWNVLGIPPETVPLILTRPISGSGALAVSGELIRTYGADSLTGRTAAVMLGSTETTFYTTAVYFGAAGIHRTRHAIPAALTADFAGFVTAALTVRLFFPPG